MTVNVAPTAWTAPGTFAVAPGIHRMPLPLPLPGLPAVNVYVVDAPSGPVLVDSGWTGAASLAALRTGLRAVDVELADITGFVVTHAHWDHYSQAVAVRRSHGTPISVGAGERPDIEGYDDRLGLYPRQLDRLVRAGTAELAERVRARPRDPHEVDVPHEPPDVYVQDGEVLAGGVLEVVTTPGATWCCGTSPPGWCSPATTSCRGSPRPSGTSTTRRRHRCTTTCARSPARGTSATP